MRLSFAAFLAAALLSNGDAAKPKLSPLRGQAVTKSDAKPRAHTPKGTVMMPKKGGKSPKSPDRIDGAGGLGFSAVYGMTNQPTNEILVYSRNAGDGTLTFEGAVPTGGSGIGQDATAPGDPLGAQDAMVVAGKCLLAVNAGSGTVSSFGIDSASVIRHVANYSTGGTIPVSIAEKDGIVYVLNAGGNGSMQGYTLSDVCDMSPIVGLIKLDQGGPVSPTEPPNGLATPAEVGFTPDGDLLVVIKVDGGGDNISSTSGVASLNHYKIRGDGTTSAATLTKTMVAGRPSSLPFAFDFDQAGNLLLAEVFDGGLPADFPTNLGLGAVTVWEETNGSYAQVATVNVGQPLTCWVRYNPDNQCAYTSNAGGDGSVSSVSTAGGSYALVESAAAGLNGPIDLMWSQDGQNLYVLSPGAVPSKSFGSGQPLIYVYEAGRDSACGLTLVQAISSGYAPSFIQGNGVAGIAVYPGNP